MKLTIEGTLPGLNDYIRACRGNRYVGARMKDACEERVAWAIRSHGIQPFTSKAQVGFLWIEPNMRRDKDNIAFGKKFILDALVTAGVLPLKDGWKGVEGFSDSFGIDRHNPRIEVTIERAT